MSEIIRLENVWKIYNGSAGQVVAVRGVTMNVKQGEFFAIVGPSGSGKTTMLHLMGGLDRPTRGSIVVAGVEITSLRSDAELSRYRNETVGFVFQLFYLVPRLRVVENVELPLIKRGIPREARRKMALEALRMVGLEGVENKYPNQLSGGEQQRVAIARAIVARPKVLLADEPTGNLDAANSQAVIELFKKLDREKGITIVMVTHNLELIWHCNRVARMHSGSIVDIYTPDRYGELIASFVKRS
ncbi:ABC transporter ATP-binding protein [Infirmifilum lucidum]|uniref:ABC transporter ATP-binding protein n=1 Tax=Infirmifilum lucidum TaxID=2776706 RepID=A0A7L9FG07_9CREN|nr:ABC transporter ATP-binding protein [Infirmifilum lucidum]QOJ78748.1 ABC transporter ATP-binding protein [Infirmifilum lucidum]